MLDRAPVVIVDDDVATQTLIARLVDEIGYQPLVFTDAESALVVMEGAREIAFAVVDIGLPGIDGLNFVRALRSQPRFERLPLLMMTARSRAEDEAIAFEIAALFVRKPLRLAVLRAALKELVMDAASQRADLGRKHRVLVVDDDDDIRAGLEDVLVDAGYEVVSAADALAALSLCGRTERVPAAAIVDLAMPGLDGAALITRLKQAKPFAAMPCVMVSALDSVFREAARVGAVAALRKPFDGREVLEVLARELAAR